MNLNTIKLNLVTLIIIVTVLLVGTGIGFYKLGNNLKALKTVVSDKEKTANALNDSIRFYKNEYNEIVAEKLTLQGTVKEILNNNNKLNYDQKQLINRVKELNKKYTIIAAANIKLMVQIDSFRTSTGVYNSVSNEIIYKDSTKDIEYKILVNNVVELKDKKSTLKFSKFYMYNTQSVDFNWGKDKTRGYPVSFTVTNTNKYFRINNIESYTIPEMDKEIIKPNGWQKIGNFFTKTGGKISIFGVGVGVGAVGIYLLTK